MITQFAAAYRTARFRFRRTWWWIHRHPRRTFILALLGVWAISALCSMPAAYAADSDNASATLPYMPPINLKDSEGVPLVHYAVLPLNRGDVWHPQQIWISGMIDAIWSYHLAVFMWVIWLLQFLLSFTWVDWIATPLSGIATLVHTYLGELSWSTLALSAAGLIGGIAIMRGIVARGAADIAVSVLCAALSIGILANPVNTLTGDHGALAWTEANGATLSSSILSDDSSAANSNPDKKQAAALVSSSLSSGLIDLFVRTPAQEVAFGHALSGQCDKVFTTQMKNQSPFDSSSTTARMAVGNCDSAAKSYVTATSIGQAITALIIASGSNMLYLLALVLAVAYIASVMWTLWQALKTMVAVNIAIAPAIGRQMLWRSFIGMWVGSLFVGSIAVILAGYLRVLQVMMQLAGKAGLTIVAQTGLVDLFVLVFAGSLFWFFIRARKGGHRLADRLARFGFGGESSGPSPLTQKLLQEAPRYAFDAMRRRPPRTSRRALPKAPARETIDGGHLTATPTKGRPAAPKASPVATGARKVTAGALTAGKVAAAASSGGTSAVVMKAAALSGKKVLQRHAVSSRPGNVLNRKIGASSASSSTPFGRRIIIDTNGVGRVEPTRPTEPDSAGVYQITKAPRPVRPSSVRAALERATKNAARAREGANA